MPTVPSTPLTSVTPAAEVAYINAGVPQVNRIDTSPLDNIANSVKGIARLQAKIQNDILEQEATDLANQYYRNVVTRMTAEDGPLNRHQKDVTDGYNGMPFTEGWMQEFYNIRNQLATDITNPKVADRYYKKVSGYDNNFVNMLSAHAGREAIARANQIDRDTITVNNDRIETGFGIRAHFQSNLAALRRTADRNGIDINDPVAKRRIYIDAQKQTEAAITNRVAALVQENAFDEAGRTLMDAQRAGAIRGDTLVKQRELVLNAQTAYQTDIVSKSTAAELISQEQPARIAMRAAAGLADLDTRLKNFAAPEVSFAAATAPAHVREQGRAYVFGDLITEYGSEDGAMTALAAGSRERMDALLAQADEKGMPVTADSVRQLMTDEEKAFYKSVRDRYDQSTQNTRQYSLADAFAVVREQWPNATREQQVAAATLAYKELATQRSVNDVVTGSIISQVVSDFESGKGINISNYDVGNIPAQYRPRFNKMVERYSLGTMTLGNDRLYMELMDNQARLLSMPETEFQLLRSELSSEQFAQVQSRRTELLGGGGLAKAIKSEQVNNAISFAAARNINVQKLMGDTKYKANLNVLRQMLWSHLEQVSQATATKDRALTQDQLNQMALDFCNTVWAYDRSFFNNEGPMTAARMMTGELTPGLKRFVAAVYSVPESNLDDQTTLSYVAQLNTRPFMGTIPTGAIDMRDYARLRQTYIAATGNEPPDAVMVRLFIADQLNNKPVLRALMGRNPMQPVSLAEPTAQTQPAPLDPVATLPVDDPFAEDVGEIFYGTD